jgi:polyisoprenoid-binding protein YceI
MSVGRHLLILLFATSFFIQSNGQKKYGTQSGVINFTSDAELELIKASTKQVRGLLDPATHQFAFTVDILSFKGFNSELQRDHFNEKYMESERYPRATFSGKIIEEVDFSKEGTYDVRAKGELEIHGQKQTRIIKGKITVSKEALKIDVNFFVPLSDHNISIPFIVNQKIASEIEVNFAARLALQ